MQTAQTGYQGMRSHRCPDMEEYIANDGYAMAERPSRDDRQEICKRMATPVYVAAEAAVSHGSQMELTRNTTGSDQIHHM